MCFQIASLSVKNLKSKYSPDVSKILDQTIQKIQGSQQAQQAMEQGQLNGQMTQGQAVNQQPGRPTQGGR